MTNDEETMVKLDRMRYTNNKFSSTLCILAIVFDVVYFISIYKTDVGTWYYSILTGASIIYNLVFLLAAFLSMEGVKNYRKTYSYVLIVIGIIQIIRIFTIPVKAHSSVVLVAGVEKLAMENAQFVRCIIYLLVSAASCIVSAVVGIVKTNKLTAYLSTIDTSIRRD